MINERRRGSGDYDRGGMPFAFNIAQAAAENSFYRKAVWTGDMLQVTLMSIPVGGEIGLEMHDDVEQFIKIEQGCAWLETGDCPGNMKKQRIRSGYAVMIPAGTWHNIKNACRVPLKLYSVYAPPKHPFGTLQKTQREADI